MIFHFKGDRHSDEGRTPAGEIDAIRLDDLIAANIESLCAHFFREGRRINGQWRVASTPRIGAKRNRPGSLAINLEGPYAGCWRDWADGTHGTFTSLLMKQHSYRSFPETARAIERCISEHKESSS
jgi:hypothetical protein